MSTGAVSRHGKKKFKIFLSHSDADLVPARKIRNLLVERLGLDVFMHNDLTGGPRLSQLRREIEACDAFVPLITLNSVSDNWLLQETGGAWGLSKTIVPIVTERQTLNQFPIAIERHVALKINELDNSKTVEQFIKEFDQALAATHAL